MHSFAPSLSFLLSLCLFSLQAQSTSFARAAELVHANGNSFAARDVSHLRHNTHRRGHGKIGSAHVARPELSRRGAATFTHFKTGLGACGRFNQPSDFIVAMNMQQFDAADHCGQTITIRANGKVAHATIVDRCVGCGYGNLDLTDGLYAYFDPGMVGTFQGEWEYGDGAPKATTTEKPTPTATATPTTTKTSTHHTTTSTTSKTKTTSTSMTSTTKTTSTTATSTTSSSTTAATPVQTEEPAGNIGQAYLGILGMSGILIGSLGSTA